MKIKDLNWLNVIFLSPIILVLISGVIVISFVGLFIFGPDEVFNRLKDFFGSWVG